MKKNGLKLEKGKRYSKGEYTSMTTKTAYANGLTLKTNLGKLAKVNRSTKVSVYDPICKKTRRVTVGDFLTSPTCPYCEKVKKNANLVEGRLKVYKGMPQPKDGGLSRKRRIYKGGLTGPLPKGYDLSNERSSKGEREVARVLCELKVPYTIEFPIYISKHNRNPLRADFCVTLNDHFYLIEFDGEQHFKAGIYGGYRELYRRMRFDDLKDRIVRQRKDTYSILRIPYWEYENIEYWLRKYLPLEEE